MEKVAIIGAGITGLTAAFALKERGMECSVFEASNRVGGCIRTIQENGFLVECGPNTVLDTHPDIGKLIHRLDLDAQKLPANPSAQNRFIVRAGKPIALPASPPAFFATKAFSAKAKWALMKEPFIRSKSNESENLADFVKRRLGQEFLDYAINPFVSGVYAGDPAKLSTSHAFPKLYALEQKYGSLIKGAILGARERKKRAEVAAKDARMFSFNAGLEVLPERLAERLGNAIRLNQTIHRISTTEERRGSSTNPESPSEAGGKKFTWEINGEAFTDVVLAIPAHAMSKIQTPFDLSMMSEIYYPPVTSLSLGFNTNQFTNPLNGFGMLIPTIENRYSLGALFPSSIFPERAPQGKALLTVFIGGAQSPKRAQQNEDEILSNVLDDLRDLLGLRGEPEYQRVNSWPAAIPQYNIGHEKYLTRMTQIESEHPGIHFAGHYRDGISVANAILSGLNTAKRIEGG